MTSLATMIAYEELQPIIDKIGCERPGELRKQLACLLAMHSCSGGSFALAYAWADMLLVMGIDPHGLPLSFYFQHPIVAWRSWRVHRNSQKS